MGKWKAADGKARGCHPTQMRVGWGGRWATGTWKKEVTAHVKLQAHRRHIETSESRHNEGREKPATRHETGRTQATSNGAWWGARKATRDAQIRHGYLPTNRQMSRRERDDSEEAALCPVCRKEEAQWNALGRCKHPASCDARRRGAEHIDTIIQEGPDWCQMSTT